MYANGTQYPSSINPQWPAQTVPASPANFPQQQPYVQLPSGYRGSYSELYVASYSPEYAATAPPQSPTKPSSMPMIPASPFRGGSNDPSEAYSPPQPTMELPPSENRQPTPQISAAPPPPSPPAAEQNKTPPPEYYILAKLAFYIASMGVCYYTFKDRPIGFTAGFIQGMFLMGTASSISRFVHPGFGCEQSLLNKAERFFSYHRQIAWRMAALAVSVYVHTNWLRESPTVMTLFTGFYAGALLSDAAVVNTGKAVKKIFVGSN